MEVVGTPHPGVHVSPSQEAWGEAPNEQSKASPACCQRTGELHARTGQCSKVELQNEWDGRGKVRAQQQFLAATHKGSPCLHIACEQLQQAAGAGELLRQ